MKSKRRKQQTEAMLAKGKPIISRYAMKRMERNGYTFTGVGIAPVAPTADGFGNGPSAD